MPTKQTKESLFDDLYNTTMRSVGDLMMYGPCVDFGGWIMGGVESGFVIINQLKFSFQKTN